MKVIILAAGEGSRLRPYTLDRPKCMVPLCGKPLIDYIGDTVVACGIKDMLVVTGYKREVLEAHMSFPGIKFAHNPDYASSNMLYSLFCAESEMTGDIIISYSDIIYNKTVLRNLAVSEADFSVVVDRKWRELWSIRMEDPLRDAETMKLDAQGNIIELGKKPGSYDDIQGQYIGLIKISAKAVSEVRDFYHSLDRNAVYDGKDFRNMYMTSFIQLVIDRLMPVKAVFIDGGWLELDSTDDLEIYEKTGIEKIIG